MDGQERDVLNVDLAAYLVDLASRKLANPNEAQTEKLKAFRMVCGFQWSKKAICGVSPHKVSSLVQRALRNDATKDLAKKLRPGLHKIYFANPPILAGDAQQWWALLSGAGLSSLAPDEVWTELFSDLEDMLIFAPEDLGQMQLDQLHLVTTDMNKGRL